MGTMFMQNFGGQTKSIMVFLKVAIINTDKEKENKIIDFHFVYFSLFYSFCYQQY